MKRQVIRTLIILLINLYSFICFSQTGADFGEVAVNDFSRFDADSSDAVVLFDVAKANLDPYVGSMFHHMRYRVLRHTAFDDWGNFVLYLPRHASVRWKAATYNLVNNAVISIAVPDSAILRTNYDKYNDKVVIAFPDVSEGSILEYQYTCKSSDIALSLPTWTFQRDVPTLRSEFTIDAPVADFASSLQGDLKPTLYEEKYGGKYRHWVLENIPSFKKEEFMPDENRYISTLRFGGFTRWVQLDAYLRGRYNFWGILQNSASLKGRVDKVTIGIEDSLQMIEAISSYLKDQIKFNGHYDFLADEPQDIFDRKFGTVGDINLVFAAMLKEAGFDVGMVLLSTRSHGLINDSLPGLAQFNYVICRVTVGGKKLLVDATEKHLPYDMLPPQCFNHQGFLETKNQYGWILIEPAQKDRMTVEANLTLDADGTLRGKVVYSEYDYAAFTMRQQFYDAGEKSLDQKVTNPQWSIIEKGYQNIEDLDKPVVEVYDLKIEDAATVANNMIYLNPNIFNHEESYQFKAESRLYPIDFGMLIDHIAMCTISLPTGYQLEKAPKSEVSILPNGSGKWSVNFTSTADKLVVLNRLEINETFFHVAAYQDLKKFFAGVTAEQGEMVVLRKE